MEPPPQAERSRDARTGLTLPPAVKYHLRGIEAACCSTETDQVLLTSITYVEVRPFGRISV